MTSASPRWEDYRINADRHQEGEQYVDVTQSYHLSVPGGSQRSSRRRGAGHPRSGRHLVGGADANASTGLNLLVGADALSTTDVWAVGRAEHPTQPFVRPVVARWTGSAWTTSSTPVVSGQLSGVDASAANNIWAVGSRDVPVGGGITSAAPTVRTLIQRWNGTSWSIVPSPNPDQTQNLLTDVDGVSATDVWAIGNVGSDGYGGTSGGLVARWNGSAWSQVNVPGTSSDGTLNFPTLQDVIALSANDVWIVGRAFSWTDFRVVPIALHWNGQSWHRSVMAGAPNDGEGFHSVAALTPTRVYAVGSVIAKWTGTAWVAEGAAVPGTLSDAVATGTATVWSVGRRYDPDLGQLRTLAMRTANG